MSAAASQGKTMKSAAHTLEEFMAQALAMEREAVQRYSEFADAMEMHNNREVAKLFRTMAQYEGKHADQIMAEMAGPKLARRLRTRWRGPNSKRPRRWRWTKCTT